MNKNINHKMVACVAIMLTAGSVLATDGTIGASGAFTAGATWVGGVIPGGPGSTMWITNGNFTISSSYTNVVLGNIVTPVEATNATLSSAFTWSYPEGVRTDGNVDPVYGAYKFGIYTNYLTFDSGVEGTPATIRCLGPQTAKYRYVFNTPIVLNSDLYVYHAGRVSGTWDNPMSAIWLGKDIRETGGRRSLTVDFGQQDMELTLYGSNTFSGNLIVNKGLVRAGNPFRYGVSGYQFGYDNTVVATSGVATVDLGGLNFGPEKPLYLGGKGANSMGALVSGCQSPAVTSVWSGPITLFSDTAVAGTVGRYPRSEGGNLRINGNITDGGRNCSLENVSQRNLILAGTNTYSKGTILTGGFLTALKAVSLGSGPLYFNGGAFVIDSATGVDLSSFTLISTNSKPVEMILGSADYTPANPFVGFKFGLTKNGPGALILKQNNVYTGTTAVARGDLILDYSQTSGQKTEPEGTINLSGDARLIIRGGTAAITGQKSRTLTSTSGANARVINDTTMPFTFNFITTGYSVLNLEGSGPYKMIQQANGTEGSAYPNIFQPNVVFNGKDWAFRTSNDCFSNYTAYATDWSGSNKHVDVTAALAATVPAGFQVSTLRFNTPNNGTPIELNLSGTNFLKGGAILVTEAMGTTPVHITGGSLARMGAGSFIIYNYNTQAVVQVDSQFLGSPTIYTNNLGVVTNMIFSNVAFVKAGPGKVILGEADNQFDAYPFIVNGELEISGPKSLGVGNWYSGLLSLQNFVYIYNGSTLTTRGNFDFCREVIPGISNRIALVVNAAGGILNVAGAGDTVTKDTVRPGSVFNNGGRLIKRGKGTYCNKIGFAASADQMGDGVIARDPVMYFEVEDGTVALASGSLAAQGFIGEGPMIMTVRSNAMLKGVGWLCGNNGGANGGGSPEDTAARKILIIEETGATVDLNGSSIGMGSTGFDTLTRAVDYIYGPGTLTVTNSSVTAASVSFNSLMNSGYTGRFNALRYMTTDATTGGGLPNGELQVPQGFSHSFLGCQSPGYPLSFGRLTGNGAFGGKGISNSDADHIAFIGCDDASTFEFSGYLWGTWTTATRGAFRYVKVGNNSWRISGTTNAMTTTVTIRKGSILVGANSFGGVAGALGTERVILGDAGTTPSDTMALLTDGAFTVGNGIILPPYAPGSVAILGGNQTTGASSFTNALALTRNVILTSANTDSPNGVTFSGAISGSGGITKTGVGTVYLTGAVTNTGPTVVQAGSLVVQSNVTLTNTLSVTAGTGVSATLAVTGNLTLGTGATLAVSAGTLVRGQTYTLVTWTGTRTGTFASTTGLPENWRIKYLSNSAVLYYAPPGTMIRVM
ncbi:MAG: autotransporter-associated beta strand repeat-containing protein [bacterium]